MARLGSCHDLERTLAGLIRNNDLRNSVQVLPVGIWWALGFRRPGLSCQGGSERGCLRKRLPELASRILHNRNQREQCLATMYVSMRKFNEAMLELIVGQWHNVTVFF